jgi:hypothetical protein
MDDITLSYRWQQDVSIEERHWSTSMYGLEKDSELQSLVVQNLMR